MKNCPKCKIDHNKPGIFCSHGCANSRSWSDEDKKKRSISAKNSALVLAENRRLNRNRPREKNPDNWEIRICGICKKSYSTLKSSPNKTCSFSCAKHIMGGLRKNSGIGKHGWFKGFWLRSTYELAYVIYCIDHNINIKPCTKIYEYVDPVSNTKRKYYPDFIVNGKIIEIKGFHSKIVDIKAATCAATVLYKEDLLQIFEYVENKSGYKICDLYKLYD